MYVHVCVFYPYIKIRMKSMTVVVLGIKSLPSIVGKVYGNGDEED